MAKTLLSVSPLQHLSLTIGMTNSCLGQHSLPANPPADQPNLTGEHTSQYSSFLAHSPNFWLTQGLRWHSAEWKNVCVVEDDENTLQYCFFPGFLLSSASALAHWPFLCLARYRALWHTVYALAIGKEYSSMAMQQGELCRVGFAIPAVIRRQP